MPGEIVAIWHLCRSIDCSTEDVNGAAKHRRHDVVHCLSVGAGISPPLVCIVAWQDAMATVGTLRFPESYLRTTSTLKYNKWGQDAPLSVTYQV